MTELETITQFVKTENFKNLSRSAQAELKEQQQKLIKQMIKAKILEQIQPILMKYDLDSDIRIYNDGEDGVKVDFVEYWSDVDSPKVAEPIVPEPTVPTAPNAISTQEKTPFIVHPLDWSPFEYGFTIDKKYHDGIFLALGKNLKRGENMVVILEIDGKSFPVKIGSADVKGRSDQIIRLLYKNSKSPGAYLQTLFPATYKYIKDIKDVYGGRRQVKLPENLKVDLEIYTTEKPLVYKMIYKPVK